MKICKFILTLVFVLFSFGAHCDQLNLSVDKDVLISGEPFYLTISYDGNSNSNPNLDPLKKDFQIISNSVSRSVNIINGNMSQTKQWRIGLIPLKEGKIKISPLKLDNLTSNYIDIDVKETTDVAYIDDSKHNSNAPFLQVKQISDTKEPYIQQQVTFLVTLYDSIGLRINNITVSKESSNNWSIVPVLETPIVDKDVVNGKKVNVIHYAFAGFPQKSGKIEEPRFIIDGYYLKNNEFSFPVLDDDFDVFGFNNVFNQQVHVKMQTKESFVNVRSIPDDYKGRYWLPLSNLTISSELKNIDNIKQGDAFNQIITITASGMQETMFPQIKFDTIDGVKSYPEKPQLSTRISKGLVETTAVFNNVYIPNKTGEIIIPSVEIDWFNINTQKIEKSSTQPEKIMVEVNPNIISQPIKIEPVIEKESSTEIKENKNEDINTLNVKEKAYKDYLFYVFYILLFVLFVLIHNKVGSKNLHKKQVIKAIKQHDYRKAREAILEWAMSKFNNNSIKNINDVSKLVNDEEFSRQLSNLNKMIYSETEDAFDYIKFIEIFKNIDKIKYRRDKSKKPIPLLYD